MCYFEVSLIGWAVISILALGEVRSFLTPKISEHMKVDFTLGQELRVNLNISFHALTCAQVHVDAMDVSGDNQVDIETQIFKQRITASGGHIGDKLNDGVGKVSVSYYIFSHFTFSKYAI